MIERMSTGSVEWWLTNELITGFVIGRGWRHDGTIEHGDYDIGGDYWIANGQTMRVLYVIEDVDQARPRMIYGGAGDVLEAAA